MATFVHTTVMTVGGDWRAVSGRHLHDHMEALVIVRGGLGAWIGGMEVEVYRGDALCYCAGVEHEEWALGRPTEFVLISTGRPVSLPGKQHVRAADGRILTLALWLVEERDAHDAGRGAREATLLDALLNEFARQSKPEPPSELRKVRGYMRDNLSRALTLEELAAEVCMSRCHFVRWYKRNTGVTPIRDLRRMRVDAACDIMRGTEEPLKVVAGKTGFCDEYYFSRVFREHVGMPPGAFRRTVSMDPGVDGGSGGQGKG